MRGIASLLHQIKEKYCDRVDFLCMYIEEAHAQDEWPISSCRWNPGGQPVLYNQPKTIEERITVAKDFIKAFDWGFTTIIDTMDNPFQTAYASWPIRLYILKDGKLQYKAQPDGAIYDMQDLTAVLDSF